MSKFSAGALRVAGRPLTKYLNERFADIHVRLDEVVRRQDAVIERLDRMAGAPASTSANVSDELVAVQELLAATLAEVRKLHDRIDGKQG